MNTQTLSSIRSLCLKAIRSGHARKTCRAGNNNAVCAAAAMDDQEIAVCVPADMRIVRVEHQIARLRVAPCDIRAIAVLCRCTAAAPRIVTAVRRIVERPIDETAAIQSERAHRAGGAAARRCDLRWNAPAVIPAER